MNDLHARRFGPCFRRLLAVAVLCCAAACGSGSPAEPDQTPSGDVVPGDESGEAGLPDDDVSSQDGTGTDLPDAPGPGDDSFPEGDGDVATDAPVQTDGIAADDGMGADQPDAAGPDDGSLPDGAGDAAADAPAPGDGIPADDGTGADQPDEAGLDDGASADEAGHDTGDAPVPGDGLASDDGTGADSPDGPGLDDGSSADGSGDVAEDAPAPTDGTAADDGAGFDLPDAPSPDVVADLPRETSDLPAGIEAIDRALDAAFLEPNRGFTLRMVTPLLDAVPADSPGEEQQPWIIRSELKLASGRTIQMDVRSSAYAAIYDIPGYDENYLYVSTGSDVVDGRYTYAASVTQTLSTTAWMKSTGVDTISGHYFWVTVYRSGYFGGDAYVVCPVMAGSSGASSAMQVHFEPGTLEPGQPLGLMVNTYLTEDRTTIATLSGVRAYHEACYCYDASPYGYSQRACTDADIDHLPGMPQAVEPENGREGVATSAVLRWSSTGDADGGAVTYDVFFGTDNPPATRVLAGTTDTAWTPTLAPDTTYYWRVRVRDDEGNEVEAPVWTFNTDKTLPVLAPHTYLIVVDKRLKGQVDAELDQYVQDILQEGAEVPAVRWWMPGGHQQLKALIRASRDRWGIRGVFLVGDLPSAWYEQDSDFGEPVGVLHEEFPTELYFQELDGDWADADGNGIYDGHPGIDLDIFSARLVGGADRIRAYLDRVHRYRVNGSFFAQRNFFSFVDDDWNGSRSLGYADPETTGNTWDLGSIYGSRYVRREWSDETGRQDYLDVMSRDGGAEFVYQWIHSDPQSIYFDDNFSPNPQNLLTLEELVAREVQGSFYNLFDCSISRYTEPDGNMATEYVHGEKGLATVGSTKTGGIFNPGVLHRALRDGGGFGEALRLWFNDTWGYRYSYGFDEEFFDGWWLGMMVQGDPLLRLTSAPQASVLQTAPPRERYSPDQLRRLNDILRRQAQSARVHGYVDSIRRRP